MCEVVKLRHFGEGPHCCGAMVGTSCAILHRSPTGLVLLTASVVLRVCGTESKYAGDRDVRYGPVTCVSSVRTRHSMLRVPAIAALTACHHCAL